MAVQSAGILLYKYENGALHVLLVHPGGPFWARKDEGAWSIPKGVCEPGEDMLQTARREFHEETGSAIEGEFRELGALRQPSGKIVHAWVVEGHFDVTTLRSGTFTLEWPRKSGTVREYPEVDRASWFTIPEARVKMLKGQRPFLDRLEDLLKA
jgi:predicted NUDIX family NTP pyrophosphohydrolase